MRRTFLSQRLLMTKKLAVFVEGLTEQEFTIRLLSELAGNQVIKFEILRQNKGHLSFVEFRTNLSQEPAIHVLVANCCHDKQVKSQINYHYKKLITDGYDLIIGLRDVHPFKPLDIPKLEENLLKPEYYYEVGYQNHLNSPKHFKYLKDLCRSVGLTQQKVVTPSYFNICFDFLVIRKFM